MQTYKLIGSSSRVLEMGKAPNTFTVHALTCGEQARSGSFGVLTSPTEIKEGAMVEIGETKTGKPKLIARPGKLGHVGYIFCASASGAYTRGTNGKIKVLRGSPQELAQGRVGFGDAGNIGGYDEAIFALKFGDVLYVRRASPSKGCTPFFVVAEPERLVVIEQGEQYDAYLDMQEDVETVTIDGTAYQVPVF